MKVDKIDEQILDLLKKDARTSNVSIAKQVNLTEGAVRRRIELLMSTKIIKNFTIDVAEQEETYEIIMVKAKADTKKMMQEIANIHITKDAYEISGDYDGCLIVSGRNLQEHDGKIDKIRALKTVKDTRTFISLKKW